MKALPCYTAYSLRWHLLSDNPQAEAQQFSLPSKRINNVLPCNNGTRPRNGQDRSLQSTRGPRSVGRGLDPSAAAVCHCDAVGAGHVRPAT